jgi:hypothetical protein
MGAFDDIIQKYGDPEGSVPAAQARFSRAPIFFEKLADLAKDPVKSGVTPEALKLFERMGTTGSYGSTSKQIKLAIPPTDSFESVQSAVRHEDVHASLTVSAGGERRCHPPCTAFQAMS